MRTVHAEKVLNRIRIDPIYFSQFVMGGDAPWRMQREIMRSVCEFPRTAVHTGHAVGKTWIAARVALWFLNAFKPSKVVTTAPTFRQVKRLLWGEIRKQYRSSKHGLLGSLLPEAPGLHIADDWWAEGWSTTEPEKFQGVHSPNLLIIFDEAPGIPEPIWIAALSCMTSANSKILLIGNPRQKGDMFHKACVSSEYNVIHIPCGHTPNVSAGRIVNPALVTAQWIEDRKRDWGEGTTLYQARVEGLFPDETKDTLVTLGMTENAKAVEAARGERHVGVDLARYGSDTSRAVLWEDRYLSASSRWQGQDLMASVGRIRAFADDYKVPHGNIHVDAVGLGAGAVDRLREQGWPVDGVDSGAGPDGICGEIKCRNLRAELYWHLRMMLQQGAMGGDPVLLDELAADVTNMKYKFGSDGSLIIESKDEIKKRLGRSPDFADACVYGLRRGPKYEPKVF